MKKNSRIQRIARLVAGNWFSRGYLAGCLGLTLWVWVDSTFVQHPDASFAGVWPLFATAPTSLVLLLFPDGTGPAGVYLSIVLGALVNAALIGWCAGALRRTDSQPRSTV